MKPISIIKTASLLIVISASFVTASAGVDNATIACKTVGTKGGVFHLAGNIPGDLAEFELSLKRNSAETKMTSKADEDILVVEDFDNKVFTMVVYGKAGRLILYAIPRTVFTSGDRNLEFKARFNAILSEAPNPAGGNPLSEVRMSCTYEYSI
jgi:hypothetical protein